MFLNCGLKPFLIIPCFSSRGIDLQLFRLGSNIMNIAIHATGKIKMVSFISGTFFLLNIPLMYVVMNLGSGAYIAYFVLIPIDIITTMVGVYIAKSLINQLNVKNVVFKGYGLNLLMIAIVLPVFMVFK